MKYFYLYNSEGRITSKGFCCDDDYDLQQEEDVTKVEGDPDLENDYVLNGVLTQRPEMSVSISKLTVDADEIDFAEVTQIPIGTNVFIDRISQGSCDDGTVELTFDTPGEYLIKLVKFPYLNKEFTINAN